MNITFDRYIKLVWETVSSDRISADAIGYVNTLIVLLIQKIIAVDSNIKLISINAVESSLKNVLGNGLITNTIKKAKSAVNKVNASTIKNVRTETKASLIFPVSRIETCIRSFINNRRISKDVPVYITAVIEHIITLLLNEAKQHLKTSKKKTLAKVHIDSAIKSNDDLSFFKGKSPAKASVKVTKPVKAVKPSKPAAKNILNFNSLEDIPAVVGLFNNYGFTHRAPDKNKYNVYAGINDVFKYISVLGSGLFGIVLKFQYIPQPTKYIAVKFLMPFDYNDHDIHTSLLVSKYSPIVPVTFHSVKTTTQKILQNKRNYNIRLKNPKKFELFNGNNKTATTYDIIIQELLPIDSQELWTFIEKKKDISTFLNIYYQLFMYLSVMSADRFTHYDLHFGNILIAKAPANSYICYVPTDNKPLIVLPMKVRVIIIDFGYAYIDGRSANIPVNSYPIYGITPSIPNRYRDIAGLIYNTSSLFNKKFPVITDFEKHIKSGKLKIKDNIHLMNTQAEIDRHLISKGYKGDLNNFIEDFMYISSINSVSLNSIPAKAKHITVLSKETGIHMYNSLKEVPDHIKNRREATFPTNIDPFEDLQFRQNPKAVHESVVKRTLL